MDTALIITWKIPFPGREKQALEFAADADSFWGKQAADGKCTSPEWFFLSSGMGMWMVKGERRVLGELVASEEATHLLVRGNLLLQDWQYTLADTGSAAERFMGEYASIGGQLGII